MSHILSNSFEDKALQSLHQTLQGTPVHISQPQELRPVPLYQVVSLPSSIQPKSLNFLIQLHSEASSNSINEIIDTLLDYSQKHLALLENNEQCRCIWESLSSQRHHPSQQTKLTMETLSRESKVLSELWQECKYGIGNRQQLLQLLRLRSKDIFVWQDHSGIYCTHQPVHLQEVPEYYELAPQLTPQDYYTAYENSTEQLRIIANSCSQYLKGSLSLQEIRHRAKDWSNPDSFLLSNKNKDALINYILKLSEARMSKMKRLSDQIRKIRSHLIRSIARINYLVTNADQHIDTISQHLNKIEEQVLNYIASRTSATSSSRVTPKKTDRVAEGTTRPKGKVEQSAHSHVKTQLNEQIAQAQQQFNQIFAYLTNQKELFFPLFYEHELKRRALKLCRQRDRMTHIEKLRFNCDYAQSYLIEHRLQSQNSSQIIAQKMKQLEELRNQLRPMTENYFRLLYEEVQRIIVLVGKEHRNIRWREKVLAFEDEIVKEFIGYHQSRKASTKSSLIESLVRSRVNSGYLKASRNEAEHFLEETYQQIISRSTPQGKVRKQSQTFNKNEVLRDGTSYLSGIMPEFGGQLLDGSNFKVYLLPKLVRKVEQTLLLIPYSQQPLNLQLTKLLQNLRFIPLIIAPEISQEKVDQLFYPKLNFCLFETLKIKSAQHLTNLAHTQRELDKDHEKGLVIADQLKSFMKQRLKFLKVWLQNLDRLQEIMRKADQMYLSKAVHDIAEEGTNIIALTLLLAKKQIKAYMLSLYDIAKTSQSPQAIRLVQNKLLALFLNSLSRVFSAQGTPNSLETLVELTEQASQAMRDSFHCMDKAIQNLSGITLRQETEPLPQFIKSLSKDLRSLKIRLERIESKCKAYSRVGCESIARQVVRVDEFLEICEKGKSISCEIIDERAANFYKLFTQLSI